MPSYNNSKISHSRCPISLQHVTRKALSQYHKGHPLRLSHGYQIPNSKWSRDGSGKPARSQGVLLSTMKLKTFDNIYMDDFDMRDEVSTRPAPSEELEPVQLDDHP